MIYKNELAKTYCAICKKQKFDFDHGILCSLTGKKPNFEETCKDFEVDNEKKIEKEEKQFLEKKRKQKLKLILLIAVGIFFTIIIFLFVSHYIDKKNQNELKDIFNQYYLAISDLQNECSEVMNAQFKYANDKKNNSIDDESRKNIQAAVDKFNTAIEDAKSQLGQIKRNLNKHKRKETNTKLIADFEEDTRSIYKAVFSTTSFDIPKESKPPTSSQRSFTAISDAYAKFNKSMEIIIFTDKIVKDTSFQKYK